MTLLLIITITALALIAGVLRILWRKRERNRALKAFRSYYTPERISGLVYQNPKPFGEPREITEDDFK